MCLFLFFLRGLFVSTLSTVPNKPAQSVLPPEEKNGCEEVQALMCPRKLGPIYLLSVPTLKGMEKSRSGGIQSGPAEKIRVSLLVRREVK